MKQNLPSSGIEREKLREKGQFWTPTWIAQAMVSYVLQANSDHIFDPAVGTGAFLLAAKEYAFSHEIDISFYGTEIDPQVIEEAKGEGLTISELENIQIRDFVQNPPESTFSSIVANPPYLRHHRIPSEMKIFLKEFSKDLLGSSIDGRAGLHIYFLLRALQILQKDGRLAFIMPADTCEGIFAKKLWKWITNNYRLDAVITFTEDATPFPNVDTNPIIFLICNDNPKSSFKWIECQESESKSLISWIESNFSYNDLNDLDIKDRTIEEGLSTGLSRPPLNIDYKYSLLDFIYVIRGIATGANDFFLLTKEQVDSIGIHEKFTRRTIARTRDVDQDIITYEDLEELEKKGRPTYLFYPDERALYEYPKSVQKYILLGEDRELNNRSLISQRNPWYKMEKRDVPPFLFAYLGRRNTRFILNKARALPLTSFLCVYPHIDTEENKWKIWELLSNEEIIKNLSLVGKSYGSGAIKVEPRALEKTPVPTGLVKKLKLNPLQEKLI
jgi:adenine-specific DNA-methyltransferase